MNETKAYYIFVLGYDLLQDYFKNSKNNECDVVFEIATKIYEDFEKSEEFKNSRLSGYDNLVEFLNNINVEKYF